MHASKPAASSASLTTAIEASLTDTSAVKTYSPTQAKEKEVFSDPELSYEKNVEASPGVMDRFLSWLAHKLFGDGSAKGLGKASRFIFWTVITISICVVLYLLYRSKLVGLIRPAPKLSSYNFTDITDDLGSFNFEKRVAEALAANDYRLATRWLYLRMLHHMDKKQLIAFAPHKTNIDYRYEIKSKIMKDNFTALSRIYEYVWYGQFVITPDHYTSHEQEFRQFEKQLNV